MFFLLLSVFLTACASSSKIDFAKKVKISYVSLYGKTPETISVKKGSLLTEDELPVLTDPSGQLVFEAWYDDWWSDGGNIVLPGEYRAFKRLWLFAKWAVPEQVQSEPSKVQ